jgi:hypothetical protein
MRPHKRLDSAHARDLVIRIMTLPLRFMTTMSPSLLTTVRRLEKRTIQFLSYLCRLLYDPAGSAADMNAHCELRTGFANRLGGMIPWLRPPPPAGR